MFGKNKKITKYCEYCSNSVNNPYYTVLFSVSHLIDSTNSQVNFVDRQNEKVYINNEKVLDYTFEIEPGIFVVADHTTEHLLCSEKCEDDFIGKHWVSYIKGEQPYYDYRQMNIFSPLATPSTRLGGENHICAYCGIQYKWNGRNWLKCRMRDTIKISGSFDKRPDIDFNKFEIVLSGLSVKNPIGEWYGYEPDYLNSEKVFLCSYDCAYELVRDRSDIIFVNSVLEKERFGAIVNETEYFNKLLSNPPHRPSFFKSMFEELGRPKRDFNPDYRDTILYNGYIPFRATGKFKGDLVEFEQYNNPEKKILFNTNLTKEAYIKNHDSFDLIRRKDHKNYSTAVLTNNKGNYFATGRVFYNTAGVGILMELMLENNPQDVMFFGIPNLDHEITGKKCLEIVLK